MNIIAQVLVLFFFVPLGGQVPAPQTHYKVTIFRAKECLEFRAACIVNGIAGGYGEVKLIPLNPKEKDIHVILSHMSNPTHALIWENVNSFAIDVNPKGYYSSKIVATYLSEKIGEGRQDNNRHSDQHALFWQSSGIVKDLNPKGFEMSHGTGIWKGQQVGYGEPAPITGDFISHALLWKGSAASVIDLNPRGYSQSLALAIADGQQVGFGYLKNTNGSHALLWKGTAASVVDLNPPGYYESRANCVSGGWQAGEGKEKESDTLTHALLWHGKANSFVDLHPKGYYISSVAGMANGCQVGYCTTSNDDYITHAMLWRGSAASYVDLQDALPTQFIRSKALGVDASGNIVGLAYDSDGDAYAVLWTPESASGNGSKP